MKNIFYIVVIFLIGCGTGQSKKIGDTVFTSNQCLSADTEENYQLMTEISVRKDEPALMKLINAGHVSVISRNTKGVIREVKFDKYLFEYEGALGKQKGWIGSDFVN